MRKTLLSLLLSAGCGGSVLDVRDPVKSVWTAIPTRGRWSQA